MLIEAKEEKAWNKERDCARKQKEKLISKKKKSVKASIHRPSRLTGGSIYNYNISDTITSRSSRNSPLY